MPIELTDGLVAMLFAECLHRSTSPKDGPSRKRNEEASRKRGYLQMSFMRMRDKGRWRNTLLVGQALLLALYPTIPARAQTAPVGNGFVIDGKDLRFIFHQI